MMSLVDPDSPPRKLTDFLLQLGRELLALKVLLQHGRYLFSNAPRALISEWSWMENQQR